MEDRNRGQPFPTTESSPNLLQRAGNHFQSTTVSALISLLPIIIPVAVIVYVVNLVDSMVIPTLTMAVRELSGERLTLPQVWGLGLGLALLVCYLVGLMASTPVGQRLIHSVISVMEWIPVVRSIVRVTQQATTVVTAQFSFSRVVFLEWPREGMVAMGFVTARVEKATTEESLAIVYIPTAPNPTSGNMALVAEDDLFETDMTVEDAMKLVFSGGIATPDALTLARMPLEYRVRSEYTGRFDKDSPT